MATTLLTALLVVPAAGGPKARMTKGAVKRERAQARRAGPSRAPAGGLTFLETASVAPTTQTQYVHRARQLVEFCRMNFYTWENDMELDRVLVEMFTELYYDGADSNEGEKMIATVGYFFPQFSKGGAGGLPRTLRALKGWRKLCPPQQRLPLPRSILFAMVGCLLMDSEVLMGLCMIVSFFAYLRPCEARALLVRHLVPPPKYGGLGVPAPGGLNRQQPSSWAFAPSAAWGLLLHDAGIGVPGKTGVLDDSVLLDNLNHLAPLFELISRYRAPGEPLFNFDYHAFSNKFQEIVVRLKLEPLAPNLYALRHGGASEDLRNRHRSPLEVQMRGRWRTSTSLRRYGKATRLMTQLDKVPPEVQQYGLEIELGLIGHMTAAGSGRAALVLRAPQPQ